MPINQNRLANLLTFSAVEGFKLKNLIALACTGNVNEIMNQQNLIITTHPNDGVIGQVTEVAKLSANSCDLFSGIG